MAQWLVAVVGRPNVGKSTLFNRIIGSRTAIVDDHPGVTRDRHYAVTEWAGRRFTLIDTGGFVPASVDVMEAAIREQAAIAIEEADVVLFVVDGREGLTVVDREVGEVLRRSRKRVLLLVNKLDSEALETNTAEFFSLGFGDPLPVAALGGRRIGDLLDKVVAGAPAESDERTDPRLKIALIGKPNVGKSSLINALLQEDRHIVTDIPGTTRDPIDAVVRYHGEEVLFVDTAGLRRKAKIKESVEFYSTLRTLKSIERCDVAAILIDAQLGLEHQDLRIIEETIERRRGAFLAVNKWDLIPKESETAKMYERALRERLRQYDFLPIVFLSALTGQRIHRVIELARQVNAEQERRIPTNELNTLLAADIAAFPPRAASGKEIKIKYVTQVRNRPPIFSFFANEPTLIDDTYRRYLENRLRDHFTFAGVPIQVTFKQK
jgi:GTP-binding protein